MGYHEDLNVVGSNLTPPTSGRVAQPGRASGCAPFALFRPASNKED